MPTRNVIVDIIEQTAGARSVTFNANENVAVDDEVLITKNWKFTTNADGTPITVALPVPTTGSIRWDYQLPAKAGYRGKGYFFLSLGDGSDVTLSSLVAAPGPTTDALVDYIDTLLASSTHSSTGIYSANRQNFSHTYNIDAAGGGAFSDTNLLITTNVNEPGGAAAVHGIHSVMNHTTVSVGQLNAVRAEMNLTDGLTDIANGLYSTVVASGDGDYGQTSVLKAAGSINGGTFEDLYGLQIDMNHNSAGVVVDGQRVALYIKNGNMLGTVTDPTKDLAIYSKVDRKSELVGGITLNQSSDRGGSGNTDKVALTIKAATAQTVNLIEVYKDAGVTPTFTLDQDGKTNRQLTAHQAADLPITADDTLNNTDMSVTVEAGRYKVAAHVQYAFDATSQAGLLQTAFGGTATVSDAGLIVADRRATQTRQVARVTNPSTPVVSITTASDGPYLREIYGIVEFSAGGTFILQAAQGTANAGVTTIYKFSDIELIKLD
jgi:hypothetical protein